MNFRPPAIDNLRAGIMGVTTVFMPLMDAMGWVNLNDEQMALWQTFIGAIVILGLLFYNPQRDG